MAKPRVIPVKSLMILVIWSMACSVMLRSLCAQSSPEKGAVAIVPPVLRLAPLSQASESPVVTALAIDPQGAFAAAAGDDHAIRLFSLNDINSGFPESSLLGGHRDWVQAIEFSWDGKLLASCAKDGRLQVWKRLPGADMSSASVHTESSLGAWQQLWSIEVPHALLCLKFVGKESLLVGGFDASIYRLDLASLQWTVDHRSESADVRSLVVNESKTMVAFAGRDGVVRIKPLNGRGQMANEAGFAIAAHNHRVRAMCFSQDDSMLYSVGEDRRLVGIELKSQSVQYQNDLGAGRLMAIERLPDDRYAVSGSDNTIRIVKPHTMATFSAPLEDPQVAWVPEPERLVGIKLIGHDGTIAVLRASRDHLFSGSFDTNPILGHRIGSCGCGCSRPIHPPGVGPVRGL